MSFLAPLAAAGAVRRESLRTLLDRVSGLGNGAQRLAALRAADTDGLAQADRVILRMIARGIEREEALRRRFPFGKADGSSPYVLSQRHGAYLRIGSGAAAAETEDVAREIELETEQLQAEAARGVAPPAFLIDAVLTAERALAAGDLARDLRGPLARQMAALERIRAGAAAAPGVWRLRGGSDYYALRLRCTAGVDASPIEVERRIGEDSRRLMGRADRLLIGFGLSRGSVGARLRALKRTPEFLYPKSESGRSRAVADMNSALARLRPYLPGRFSPPLGLGSSVRRMSPDDERAARRGYRDPPTAAGPGAYYPDLSALNERPSWTLTTVAYHETIPGHLLQLGHQAAADPHPLQVRYAPGFSEGWATYAEALVDDMGLLSPAEQVGLIQSLLFRLARVTCDIGIHFRQWDRARAIAYLEEIVGFELFFPFAVEVDRYAAEPGAFAGDATVALTLRRLGQKAAASGRLRHFHAAVLDRGPMSAEAIERIV
ncbi:MAG TPA: DUF885 domain-containing protein [Allosphingosinicella sp.]|nr:DUF885 domain-containing protein [Allosphingosinicella sp.]